MWYKFAQDNKEKYCKDAVNRLFIFDIDETLFRTFAKIFVKCNDGTEVVLDNQQLNSFDLQNFISQKQITNPDATCYYDFDEFKRSDLFVETSEPIWPMIKKLQYIQRNFINKNKICGTDSKIILNTARSDFDNVDMIKSYFASFGIDISEVHLHRAGNMPGKSSGERKNKVLQDYGYLQSHDHFELVDDSWDNIIKFFELRNQYPNKQFVARYVLPHGLGQQTIMVTPENIDQVKLKVEQLKAAAQISEQTDTSA